MREPTRSGGGVFHSALRILTYHTGALSGSAANAATTCRGRAMSILVSISTTITLDGGGKLLETTSTEILLERLPIIRPPSKSEMLAETSRKARVIEDESRFAAAIG